jgi:hypothetical protein
MREGEPMLEARAIQAAARALVAAAVLGVLSAPAETAAAPADRTAAVAGADHAPPVASCPLAVIVFGGAPIHFDPESPDPRPDDDVSYDDSGREAIRAVALPGAPEGTRVIARVVTRPIPKDELSVDDPWDRAGNVRLSLPGRPDIEIVKFVTAYGGVTEHDVDVTHLASVLRGECVFKAFIDTWLTPAWTIDFSLVFEPGEEGEPPPDWVLPLLYEPSATAESLGESGYAVTALVPDGAERVVLYYLASGHCTDGRDADEFVSKDNVITVDGVVVDRFRPWRDDCRRFRDINPYTRRWSDGSWSSDYSRSGWCPGDWVRPIALDLTDHLGAGPHTVGVNVEGVRPKGDDGNLGYWRVSSYLVGWNGP